MSHLLTRRNFLQAAGAAAIAGSASVANEAPGGAPRGDVIDCHTHFYDPTRPEGIVWPRKGSSLYRTVLPTHLRAVPQALK